MYSKILMVQERGRHAVNWQFRESENFRRAFTKLGVKREITYCERVKLFLKPVGEM